MTEKTATERLRELLDERGVEWESKDVEGVSGFHDTRWNAYGVRWCYAEFVGNNYTKLIPSSEFHCTPEQAIAMTLGGGKLTAEQVRECVQHVYYEGYNDGSVHRYGIEETDWQAIADELNEMLGGEECELVYGENDHGDDGWWCQSCSEWFAASFRHTGRNNIIYPRYCQHCGKAVKR